MLKNFECIPEKNLKMRLEKFEITERRGNIKTRPGSAETEERLIRTWRAHDNRKWRKDSKGSTDTAIFISSISNPHSAAVDYIYI